MEFRLLGPLEIVDGDAPIALGGAKPRALLALLLLNANRTVTAERLIDELWGDRPPETARKMVQIYVSQLRKLLPQAALQTRTSGYSIEVRKDQLDVNRFESLAFEAREALAAGDAARAAAQLRSALLLWRGPALAEFDEPLTRVEAARLEDLRMAALEDRIEADLQLGRHRDLTGELEALVRRHPERERLRAQRCSRSTAPGVTRTHSPRTARDGGCWTRSSASSPQRRCGNSSSGSFGRTPRSRRLRGPHRPRLPRRYRASEHRPTTR